MSIYPIHIKKQSGRANSVSGGKDYHLVLIVTAEGRSLFIKRFGKKGTWGVGFEVTRYDTVAEAEKAYQGKYNKKLGKDYSALFIDTVKTARDWAEFRKIMGEAYWNKIGAGNLEFIMPGADTTGVREDHSVEFEQDTNGKMRVKERPKRLIPDVVESVADRAVENPIFGLF
jgi:hypothetical protein